MSSLMAWAQCISPQTAAFGLYWKNMWYWPCQKVGPLGSFIQFFSGSRWKRGRKGSLATWARNIFSSGVMTARKIGEFARPVANTAAAPVDCRNFRREKNIDSFPNEQAVLFVRCGAIRKKHRFSPARLTITRPQLF